MTNTPGDTTPASPVPAEAIHAAAVVIHRSRCAASCQHKPDRASTAVALLALSAAAPFIAARTAAAQREGLAPLIRALHRLYQVVWHETTTVDGGTPGYNWLSYDDTNAVDEAAAAVEGILVSGEVADVLADVLAAAPPATPQPPAPEERPPDAHHGER